MTDPIVVWGVGQLGGLFARGFLRLGHSVHPVVRTTPPQAAAELVPHPQAVLVAVGENDLEPVLVSMPSTWRSQLVLLQNELVPASWQRHVPNDPSVCVVWFEKKPHSEVRIVLPSICYGPNATLLSSALRALSISTRVISEQVQLQFELALKNLYVLTINCAGLMADGDVGTLWSEHHGATLAIARDLIELQAALMGTKLDSERLLTGLEGAILADPKHASKGRTAPDRLARCLAHADRFGLDLAALKRLSAATGNS